MLEAILNVLFVKLFVPGPTVARKAAALTLLPVIMRRIRQTGKFCKHWSIFLLKLKPFTKINWFFTKIFLAVIWVYSYFISPLLPASCRFYPTCSAYAREAYMRYGVLKGSFLTVKRILKCHPYHPGGYDPVP